MTSRLSCIGIIPARGGSKGIPRKNLQVLAGKPLVVWAIEAAKGATMLDRVFVSTDDSEIGALATRHGAEVIWRPTEISGDTATTESALLHALGHLQQAEGYEPGLFAYLQCTSPLTLPEDVDGTVQALLDQKADTALAVTPFHYFLWRGDESGYAVGINHDKRVRPLRQTLEPQYLETGAVYALQTQGFMRAKHRFFGKTAMYIMPPERAVEIDEPVDLRVAEAWMRERQEKHEL